MLKRDQVLKPVTFTFRPWVIALFVLCPPMWVLVWFALYEVPWTADGTPAWVQAVGSIGAIIAAIVISQSEARRQRLDSHEREVEYMLKAFHVSGFADGCVRHVARSEAEEAFLLSNYVNYSRELTDAYEELSKFQYANFISLEFANAWLNHKRYVRLVRDEVGLAVGAGSVANPGATAKFSARSDAEIQKMKFALIAFNEKVESTT